MPVRIYALAKELGIENKDLVDICKRLGIDGKGSALASLTDEETAKVKAHLAGPPRTAAPAAAPPLAPQRPILERPAHIKPPTIRSTPRPAAPQPPAETAPADSPPADSTPPETLPETPVEEAAPEEESPVATPVQRPAASTEGAPQRPAYSREDAYVPSAGSSRIRVLGGSGGQSGSGDARKGGEEGAGKPKKKRAPAIRLARAPEVKQPTPPPASAEPKAQEPEMRLPQDVIRRTQKGEPAPLQHLTERSEKKRRSDEAARAAGGTGTGTPVPAGETDLRGPARRRGRKTGEPVAGDAELAGMAGSKTLRQKRRTRSRRPGEDDDDGVSRGRRRLARVGTNTAAPRKGNVVVELPCTVRSLSEAGGVNAAQILRALMGMGVMAANINAVLDDEVAQLVATELGLQVEFKQPESAEDVLAEMMRQEDPEEALVPRPPVVTFLGHVDHGKTSLLDRIIGINVVSGEAGGITQHIRAYQVDKDGRRIAFVDTPGHEAFTEMRARGANVTDIAVLVVAADDGVMPQTEEALSHARAAEVPIVVAMNKMDLPGANPDKVYAELAARNLLPSTWGGDVEVVPCSAITGDGVDELLETLLVTAELHEYKANPDRAALGTCLEAEQEGKRGVMAKVMVKNGTLRVGDVIVCGPAYGRVKAMYDTLRPTVRVEEAGPSMPVNITGLDIAPGAGDAFYVLDDIAQAREIAESRSTRTRESSLVGGGTTRVSFEDFMRRLEEGRLHRPEDIVTLNLILRADTQGSIEAIEKELSKIDHPEVRIRILQDSVGGVSTGDVTLASASGAVIVAFNVIPDEAARALADERGVEIRRYEIIYKVADDVKAILEGRLKPEKRDVELGRALVKQVFAIGRNSIAGCQVLDGVIERNCRLRVFRENRLIGEYPMESLRREKNDVPQVPRGMECGIKLSGFGDIKVGDILEAYKVEEFARTL